MAKQGVPFTQLKSTLRAAANGHGWALCIGAGSSAPMFPSWATLVRSLVERKVGAASANAVGQELGFSPDAVIQAARDQFACTDAEFASILSEELYGPLRKECKSKEWQALVRAFSAAEPKFASRSDWETLVAVAQRYPSLTALPLARLLVGLIDDGARPAAVLSFNAEPLLFSLVLAISTLSDIDAKRAHRNQVAQRRPLSKVTSTLTVPSLARIPYFFCHGELAPPGGRSVRSPDKLVFSEGEYLQLAGAQFSWQGAVFTDAALFHRIVFVGVSLSDPNMRRWLSAVHAIRSRDVQLKAGKALEITQHYWLRKRSGNSEVDRWTESCVAHLGVRVVWLGDWGEIEPALRCMLGM